MKRFNLRHQCALGALAGAMAFAPSAASAQDTTTTEQDTDLVAAADVDDGNVIIVRAQGRDQTLSDVPVAVSAVTAENTAEIRCRRYSRHEPGCAVAAHFFDW